jgi:hypothetical protein
LPICVIKRNVNDTIEVRRPLDFPFDQVRR